MATTLNFTETNSDGFTLLELLIALAIGSIVMFATYTLVNDTFKYHKITSARTQQLLDMVQIKRLLQSDFMALLPGDPESPNISEDENTLSIRCEGDIVWDMQLGVEVAVQYELPRPDKQTLFTRKVTATSGKTMPMYDITIQGLQEVHYEVLDQTGWKPLGEIESPILAMRWRFIWADIGTWEVVVPIEPQKTTSSTS